MTTPSPFLAWHAEALELSEQCEDAAHNYWQQAIGDKWADSLRTLQEARAALSAHLLAVPMGSPAAEAVMNLCADHQGPVEAMTYIPEGTFLFTKPEGMA